MQFKSTSGLIQCPVAHAPDKEWGTYTASNDPTA